MKNKILIIFLIVSQTFLGQNINDRKIGDFRTLKVYDLINLELIKAEENYARITGDHSNSVVIKNKNGELKIRMGIEKRFRGANTIVKIYYNNIEKLFAHEGTAVHSKEKMDQTSFFVHADEGSSIDLKLKVQDLSTKTNSGAIMSLKGNAAYHRAKINTGGELRASKLETEETEVFLSTGGQADVSAIELINATVRAGGSVNVYSKTKKIIENTLAGGKVNYLYEE
tara:strand:+ start:58 stop:738 length:681 start_codon:yes stop_codon:yes gene_type:complete